jgi:E3 ubiquitin-protein ligase RFWD2
MLAEKKQHVQQEEAEVNMEILMDFLEKSRRQKQAQLDEVWCSGQSCVEQ